MPRVRIYRGKGSDEEQLKKLLEEANCTASEESDDEKAKAEEPIQGGEQDCDPDVLVIVLTPELAEDDALEPALKEATNAGSIIVGIWPKGAVSGEAPAPFKKYSSDQVIWDAERVRRAICGTDDEPAYEDPKGASQKAPDTPRHCC